MGWAHHCGVMQEKLGSGKHLFFQSISISLNLIKFINDKKKRIGTNRQPLQTTSLIRFPFFGGKQYTFEAFVTGLSHGIEVKTVVR